MNAGGPKVVSQLYGRDGEKRYLNYLVMVIYRFDVGEGSDVSF